MKEHDVLRPTTTWNWEGARSLRSLACFPACGLNKSLKLSLFLTLLIKRMPSRQQAQGPEQHLAHRTQCQLGPYSQSLETTFHTSRPTSLPRCADNSSAMLPGLPVTLSRPTGWKHLARAQVLTHVSPHLPLAP